MPTINFSLKDLQGLVGKNISLSELKKLVEYGKGEFENYDEGTDECTVGFDDTNLPYLWSVEGIARLFRGVLGKSKGIQNIKINNSDFKILVDKTVKDVRPFVVGFVAKGKKIDDYLLKQIIQLQEKFCESYGRKRLKVAVGIYSFDKVSWPISYKATDPESVEFVPLEFKKSMTQQEILEEHPKGKEYAWILKDAKKYPLLVDNSDEVLSFPPIINSNFTGKIEEGDDNFFIEATGNDMNALNLAMNIFAYAFYERGFQLYSVKTVYPDKKTINAPDLKTEKIKLQKDLVEKKLGLSLKDSEIKKLLEKGGFNYSAGTVEIPAYRHDILHNVDIIEDIGIMYGYDAFEPEPLTAYTVGSTSEFQNFVDKVCDIIVGLGFQEVVSPYLTSKEILYDKMNIKEFGTIEIIKYSSEAYSVLRSWILPQLMDFLSKNKHVEYPHNIFEQGPVVSRKGETVSEFERIAVVSADEKTDYTKIRQVLDDLLALLGVKEIKYKETDHDSFIKGRVARVSVDGRDVAYIGEVHPKVLQNFDLQMPVVALELNLSELFEILKK